MKSKVEIIQVVKKEIINKRTKGLRGVSLAMSAVLMCCIVMILIIGRISINEIGSSMCYIYNPVNSLYSDNSGIVFAGVNAVSRDNLDFCIPIVGGVNSIDNSGAIVISVGQSIMVKACESGIVEDVGESLDGKKYVKILHCLDVCSIIENIDIVGVEKGDIVKRGQDIATAKENSQVRLWLKSDGEIIENIKINESKIVWEN